MRSQHSEILDPTSIGMRAAGEHADRLACTDRDDPQGRIEAVAVDAEIEELFVRGRSVVPVILERLLEGPVRRREIALRIELSKSDAGRWTGSLQPPPELNLHVPEPAGPLVPAPRQQLRGSFVLSDGGRVQASFPRGLL